jgi:alkylation response protein AidB-like acyl-CoA dehydrogenase
MATALTEPFAALKEEAARFAREHIDGRPGLGLNSEFPWDIWRSMGESGLLGLTLPTDCGGRGMGYLGLVTAGEALVRNGGNLGLAVSACIHNVVSRFLVLGLGNSQQHQEYLPDLAAGRKTCSLAVSEPNTGAHPKHLRTTASKHGDEYRLDGEKTYLTNGPIADLFVVVAITGKKAEKNLLTAFLVPDDAPGLSKTEPMTLDFLRPSPHGGIELTAAAVPESAVLGSPGTAYESVIKPFREIEDAAFMGPMVGGMARQLDLVADIMRQTALATTKDQRAVLGQLQYTCHTARILAYETARMPGKPNHPEFLSLLLSTRNLFRRYQSELASLISSCGLEASPDLELLTKDLTMTGAIARKVSFQKQIKMGETVLHG